VKLLPGMGKDMRKGKGEGTKFCWAILQQHRGGGKMEVRRKIVKGGMKEGHLRGLPPFTSEKIPTLEKAGVDTSQGMPQLEKARGGGVGGGS